MGWVPSSTSYSRAVRRSRPTSVYETLRQVREQEPVPPAPEVVGSIATSRPSALKCLEKDPRRRYPSAEAVAADLDRWLSGEPIAARPIGPVERAWRWCRRNRVVAGLSAAVAGLLVTVAIVASVAAFRQKALVRAARIRGPQRSRPRPTASGKLDCSPILAPRRSAGGWCG